jgi:hypothetical protein
VAIKGKSRSRGAKTVARGPKPAYVPVTRPLLRRRGFWIGTAIVLGVLAVAGIAYGIVAERNADRDRELTQRKAAAVREYGGQLDGVLSGIGQQVPPASYRVFQDLGTTIDGLRSGDVSPADAASAAKGVADQAQSAHDTIDGIDALAIVSDKGFDQTFVLYVLDSKDGLVSSLELYRQAALLTRLAATNEDVRSQALDRAKGILAVAESTFATAYQDYVEAQASAGTFQPVVPGTAGATGPTAP